MWSRRGNREMSFSLEAFKHTKMEVIQSFHQLSFLLDEMALKDEHQKLVTLRDQLENEQFTIVVVGEFSRGKSTFVNALLGRRVLPSLVRPTTAVLNVITYQPTPSIQLHFHNEQEKSRLITEDEFKRLIAPKEPIEGDIESEREYQREVEELAKVKYAEIGHPLDFCQNGVQLIDTPGTNDLDPAREQITNTIIPNSDAAILLLAATKILSESETSFLRDRLLANDISKIFVVINFKDLMEDEREINKVMSYAEEKLAGLLPNAKIHMVAAKEALNYRRIMNGEELTVRGEPIKPWPIEETGFLELEQALADFLQFDRGVVKMKKPIQQATKMIDRILSKQIDFEKKALLNQMNGVQAKVDAFYPKIAHVKKVGADAQKTLDFTLKKEAINLEDWYKAELKSITAEALNVFDANRYLDRSEINRKVEDAIAPMERKLHEEKKEKISTTIKMAIANSSSDVNEEWLKLDYSVQNIWSEPQGSLVPALISFSNEGESQPTIFDEIYEELEGAWEGSSLLGKVAIGAGYAVTVVANGIAWLWGALTSPKVDEKAKMRRELTSQLSEKERQKVRAFQKQWKSTSKSANEQFAQTIHKHIAQIEGQLEQIKSHANLEKNEVQKKIEVIKRREKKLLTTKEHLHSLYTGLSMKSEKVEV